MKKLFLILIGFLVAVIQSVQADEYVPQVREGVEWGYVNNQTWYFGNISYYRLQFSGETEINGKTYSNLYMYSTYFLNPSSDKLIAWMREEDKKVYAILNPEYADFAFRCGCIIFREAVGNEVLLMDYGVSLNQHFMLGSKGNEFEFECTNIETIKLGDTSRKKFTLMSTEYTGVEGKEYEMVEGIGPLTTGDIDTNYGTFILPYCLDALGTGQYHEGWLYEREVLEPYISPYAPELDVYTMGELINTSPIFAEYGIHDPTIWYWKNWSNSGVDTAVENDEVEMRISDGKLIFSSGSVSKVNVYQVDGMLLDVITAAGSEAPFRFDKYGHKVLILTAVMTDGRTIVRKVASR